MLPRFRFVVLFVAGSLLVACGGGDTEPLTPGLHAVSVPDSVLVDARVQSRPEVAVISESGSPRSGATVTFRVVSGGGVITDSVQTTNNDGKATLGTWTLGPTAAENVVEASVQGLTSIRFATRARWPRRLATNAVGACAMPTTTIYCWGDNTHAELGSTGALASLRPVATTISIIPPSESQPVEIAGTWGNHMCARSAANVAICWGRGSFGQLGRGVLGGEANLPNTNVFGSQWAFISVGRISTCALQTTGAASCWGTNQYGEVGAAAQLRSSTSRILGPVPVDGGIRFTALSAGWLHACGIAVAGETWCWGNNQTGQLGVGVVDSLRIVPTIVTTNERFVKIAAGNRFTCALTADGRAFCWGENRFGQLGDGTTTLRSVPTLVAGGLRFTDIQVGSYFVTGVPPGTTALPAGVLPGHACALTEAGKPYCWGWNAWGQLGDGTTTDRLAPVAVGGNLVLNGLSLGESMSCGMRGTSVWCWGSNHFGQIGDGTAVQRSSPVRSLLP